jgi:hypothetical protein
MLARLRACLDEKAPPDGFGLENVEISTPCGQFGVHSLNMVKPRGDVGIVRKVHGQGGGGEEEGGGRPETDKTRSYKGTLIFAQSGEGSIVPGSMDVRGSL